MLIESYQLSQTEFFGQLSEMGCLFFGLVPFFKVLVYFIYFLWQAKKPFEIVKNEKTVKYLYIKLLSNIL